MNRSGRALYTVTSGLRNTQTNKMKKKKEMKPEIPENGHQHESFRPTCGSLDIHVF